MNQKVSVYGMNNCPFCKKLMELLDTEQIEYEYVDCDSPDGERKFIALTKITKSNGVPVAIVGKNILVPDVSFKKIPECVELIKDFLKNEEN